MMTAETTAETTGETTAETGQSTRPASVPRRRICAKVMAALGLGLLLSASGPSCGVYAQGNNCAENCKAAFGACYKSTANRAACEMQYQRCLEGCIIAKRG